MKNAITKKLGSPDSFFVSIFKELNILNIDVSGLFMDHICYRVGGEDRYQELKDFFSKEAFLLSEEKVSGRMIATYKLKNCIVWEDRKVDVLELPNVKKGSVYQEGFQHVEFVVESLDDFKKENNRVNFREGGREGNYDLSIKFANGSAVKFHELPLEKVIEYEKNRGNC